MISPIDKAIQELPAEHREFLSQIRRFVTNDCAAVEAEMDRTGHPPPALLEQMRELGLFGLTIPEEHGGLGLGLTMFCCVLRELSRTSPVVRTYMNINNGIGSRGIVQSGSPEQKERYLAKIASGEIITAFCLTEPGAGSDAAAITTRAERTANGWRLNGTKHFITNAPFANLFTVIAVTDPAKGTRGGISAFLVERDNPGLQVGPVQVTMGGMAQHQSEVILENCDIAEDALLGAIGDGFKVAMKTLDEGRISLAASAISFAERSLNMAVEYAAERQAFKQRIADFQGIQWLLADSATELYAASCMLLDACRGYEAGESVTTQASMLKLFATERACEIADRSIQVHGGYGYTLEGGVEKIYRYLRMFRIVEGTSEVQRMKIARSLVGRAVV